MHQSIRTETDSEEKVSPKDTAVVRRSWTRTETRSCVRCPCANYDKRCWHAEIARKARGKESWRWADGISYKVGVFPHTIQVIPESCDVSFTSFARMCCRSYSHAFTLQKRRKNLTVKTIVTSLSLKDRWSNRRFEHLHQWICFNREDVDSRVHETDSPDPVFVEEFGANTRTGGCSDEHGIPKRVFDKSTRRWVEGRTCYMGQNPWDEDTCVWSEDSELIDRIFSCDSDFMRTFQNMYESVMGNGTFRHNKSVYTFLKFTDGAPSSFIISFGKL